MTKEGPNQVEFPRSITLDLSFRSGWCSLTLNNDTGATVTIKASMLFDAFANLVAVAGALDARTAPCQSSLWGGENDGWFVDLSVNDYGGLGLVVHEMESVRWLSDVDAWQPVRGSVVFREHVERRSFLTALAQEAGRVRSGPTEEDGTVKGWGKPFPEEAYQHLIQRV